MKNTLKRIAVFGMTATLALTMLTPMAWSQTAARSTTNLPPAKSPMPALRFAERANGQKAINNLGKNIAAVAAHYGKNEKELREQLLRDKTLWLDKNGRLLFVDEAMLSSGSDLAKPGMTYPPEQTFFLHSRPSSKRKIYLDFNGQVLSGTAADGVYAPFDTDGIPGTFSASELATIQTAWKRIAEDYAPFDVDVTTEEPPLDQLTRTSLSDDTFGIRLLITKDTQNCGCGGYAYVGVFDNTSEFYKVAMVFNTDAMGIASAASHEAGHTLGLSHDGTSTSAYYRGHVNGTIGWVPIMGAGYDNASVSLTQFSKGEYFDANNKEDDYLVMQNNGITFAPDDFGDTTATAAALIGTTLNGTTSYDVKGVIGTPMDVDVFKFSANAGTVTINATPFEIGANLDILLQLLNASGSVIAQANPTGSIGASLNVQLPATGTYYVRVQGTGAGDPLGTGYTSYGSIGRYSLSVNAPTSVPVPVAAISSSATSGSAPLTVSFSGAASTDPNGTLQRYEWDFGDGSPVATGVTTSHTYTAAGSYNASLKVTSSSGLSNSTSVTITVTSSNSKTSSVESINMTLVTPLPGWAYAQAAVTVKDGSGKPIPNAIVSGAWGGIVNGAILVITNANGVAISNSPFTNSSGTIKYTVNSIIAPGYTYDPTLNKMTTNAVTK